jgi:biopolymer transport protein ExbD
MAGADVGGGAKSHSKGKRKKAKKRLNIRIDMTPMVDVAFLLLTFFMLTTVMRKQQTLEINLPPDNKVNVEIAESNLMQLFVNENDKIFWAIGTDTPKPVDGNLTNFFTQKLKDNPKLVVLIKIDRKSKFHMMVDIIDQLNLANLQRFSIIPITDNDKKILSKVS